jgi:SAM-dependent methyltransferase
MNRLSLRASRRLLGLSCLAIAICLSAAAQVDNDESSLGEVTISGKVSKQSLTTSDGRRFLEDCREPYDFCVLDTYSGDAMPFHLASLEAFESAKRVLKPGGILAINYIGAPSGRAFASIYKTLQVAFANVLAIKGEDNDRTQTITMFASARPIEFNSAWLDHRPTFTGVDPIREAIDRLTVAPDRDDGLLLTDDYNPIDFLRSAEAIEWRRRTVANIGERASF